MLSKKLLSTCQTAAAGGSGIEFIGVNNGDESGSSSGTSPLVTFGSSAISGVQSGDLLLVYMTDDLTQSLSNLASGWSTLYYQFNVQGSSTIACFIKTATSSDTSFSIDGSNSTNAPSSVMMAFRNASYTTGGLSMSDDDDPPSVQISSGDAVVIALHYQDDNFRASPTDSDLPTAAGNAFRYVSSATSSGTLTWYNLSPSDPYNVGDININDPNGELAASSVVLSNT